MQVEIEWNELGGDDDPLWSASFCLYAYLHPHRDWLLYIGKADRSTLRCRFRGAHKEDLFYDLERKYGISSVRVLQGELYLESGRRRSSELLTDVESLLITRLTPFGNIQSRYSRIARPGLQISCMGDWPFKRRDFHDID